MMEHNFLTTPWQRSIGAMFKKTLGDTALVFAYPHAAPRLFHTAFCARMRILAFDEVGEIIFDELAKPFRFLRIPATRYVVELAPEAELTPDEILALLAQAKAIPQPATGSWSAEASLDRLFFALLAEAVGDIRRVYEINKREKKLKCGLLPQRFKPWERGEILGSAALVLESADRVKVPENANSMSRQILRAEKQTGHLEELLAASFAGYPWGFPRVCFKCEATANWRPVLTRPHDMPVENAWRYTRPENHVPICRRCVYVLNWKEGVVRGELALMLWGARFEAFTAWHQNWQAHGSETTWNLETNPLWPTSCGGETWALGSGAWGHAAPQEPHGVSRTAEHLGLLDKYFSRKTPTRRFWTTPQPNPVSYEPAYPVQGAGL